MICDDESNSLTLHSLSAFIQKFLYFLIKNEETPAVAAGAGLLRTVPLFLPELIGITKLCPGRSAKSCPAPVRQSI
jgi:hypothetical protein